MKGLMRLALVLALSAAIASAIALWQVDRYTTCIKAALGPVQEAPPEYCFEGDGGHD